MTITKAACVGRPRGFDIDLALEQALNVFWRNGYEGTSINELTEVMGIKKPSLYAAFGNKEQLFLKAIELYENRPDSLFNTAFKHEHIADVFRGLLFGAAAKFTDCSHPQGCALINSTLSCTEASESIKQAVMVRKGLHRQQLIARFEQAKDQDELNTNCQPEVLARFISILLQGMSIQASEGASIEELQQVASMAVDGMLALYVNH
ncbi:MULTISPECIES: TetR/AcrR family transcriptional regulator [Shewanella]|uniref:TetR/AcrR family transcriptional regulator n=1 Tax=Shewanella polaris TaxID=2588449 RepID=A0A4Y5YJM0_9GAMM|nr:MULTISPECIES: TetR/AcrR family transcriptional regulator [Shewanella]QDE32961.1 TetR/AcrR family transcriptional regulator [Shewanella polaris]